METFKQGAIAYPDVNLEDIDAVSVLGAGTMGHGIAEVAAIAGYDVTMCDVDEEPVREGLERIEWSIGKLAEKGRLAEAEADAVLERITPVVDLSTAVREADVVVEAVPEELEIKREVYEELEADAPEKTIFATNTSSLSITTLASFTDRPERVCGMHFFNPPVRMDLVEVIPGEHTDGAVLDVIEALAENLGKTPVRVERDAPGFIVNRVLVPLLNEACWLVSDGESTITEVDSTATYELGFPMAVFALADSVGIDVCYHVLEHLHAALGDAYEPAPLLVETVEDGRLGKKTGSGFYEYDDGPGVAIPADDGSALVNDRLIATMANEVAKLIGDGVAPPASIDEAVTLGAGVPDGPVSLSEAFGLERVLDTLEAAHEETSHARYEPAPHLRERATVGDFYDRSGDDVEFDTIRVVYPGERVGHVVLDRPHRMNTITEGLLGELETAVDRFEADDDVRAILVTGEGERAFSAGADVHAVASGGEPGSGVELSRRGQSVFGRLEASDLPVVAGIDGYCLGGGMELATAADLRIASGRSTFGQPELNLGLLPGWGGTQRLARVVGEGRAREIILTGRHYDAETMAEYGFVNEVVTDDELVDSASELAADLAAGPPVATAFTKRAILTGRDDVDAGFEYEAAAFGQVLATDDLLEGVRAFVEDDEPEFEGK